MSAADPQIGEPPAGSIVLDLGMDTGELSTAGRIVRTVGIGDRFRFQGRTYLLTGKPRGRRRPRQAIAPRSGPAPRRAVVHARLLDPQPLQQGDVEVPA